MILFYLSARALSEQRSQDWLILRQAAEVSVWFSNLEVLLDDINGRNNCEFSVKKSNGSHGDSRNGSKAAL